MSERLPNALRLACGKPPALAPAAVLQIDYEALVAAAWERVKVPQGTLGCVAFAKGAEWMLEQVNAQLASSTSKETQ